MSETDALPTARSLRPDDRGVSPVIAVLLLLAIAVMALSIFQTAAIPQLNAQHEFEHSQRVGTDMLRLETTVDRIAATGVGETVAVETGLAYPSRLLFVNPPPTSGTLSTTDIGPVEIDNAVATGETRDYWNGSARTFATASLQYAPDYNEYDGAPVTVYEPWVLYDRFAGGTVTRTGTDLVDGREISLVALDGRLSRSGARTMGVDLEPTSAPVRTVTVRDDGEPITITVPTDIPEGVWRDLLAGEFDPDGTDEDAHVSAIDCRGGGPETCGELTLTLEPGSYDLRLGEVAVDSGASREPAQYLTDIEGNATAVTENGRQRLVVEARDRYDNPVSGVDIDPGLGGDNGTVRAVDGTTGADGRATFVYEAPESVSETRSVTVETAFGDGGAQRTVAFDIRVVAVGGDADGTGADIQRVTGVEGSIGSRRIGGVDRGRELSFRVRANDSVTITDFTVTTRGDLEGRSFEDVDSTFDGNEPPVTFSGEIPVALREFEGSDALEVTEFVDPRAPEADVIVVLELADGETTLGLG